MLCSHMNFEKLKLLLKERERRRSPKQLVNRILSLSAADQCSQLALCDLDQLKGNFYLNGIGFSLHLGLENSSWTCIIFFFSNRYI